MSEISGNVVCVLRLSLMADQLPWKVREVVRAYLSLPFFSVLLLFFCFLFLFWLLSCFLFLPILALFAVSCALERTSRSLCLSCHLEPKWLLFFVFFYMFLGHVCAVSFFSLMVLVCVQPLVSRQGWCF